MSNEHGQRRADSGQGSNYWPRRLLHIPTMYSAEKEELETYHGSQRPRFATLSYTWGRYEKPGVSSLPVLNVPWRVPSVDPMYFTVKQMQRVIGSIQSICHLDFLWLDIACLNFSQIHAGLDDGVASQRAIFASASKSFVWLSQIPSPKLSTILDDLQESIMINQAAIIGARPLDETLSYLRLKALPALRELLEDPWFTSLWTLQEAMVSPCAILLPRNGRPICSSPRTTQLLQRVGTLKLIYLGDSTNIIITSNPRHATTRNGASFHPSDDYISLQDLASLCRLIQDLLGQTNVPEVRCPLLQELSHLIYKSGLPELLHFNVLKLWDLARDRMKGHPRIQLEYLYRSLLGSKLALDSAVRLDNETLARHLLVRFPASAQMFIREHVSRTGISWLYDTGCTHPNLEALFERVGEFMPQLTVTLSVELPQLQIEFTGRTLDFASTMDQFLECRGTTRLVGLSVDRGDLEISGFPKVIVPAMPALPYLRPTTTHGTATWIVDSEKQASVVERLAMLLGQIVQRVKILVLACAPHIPGGTTSMAIGSIICQTSESTWQRLGWCCWVFDYVPQSPESSNGGDVTRSVGLDGLSMSQVEGYAC